MAVNLFRFWPFGDINVVFCLLGVVGPVLTGDVFFIVSYIGFGFLMGVTSGDTGDTFAASEFFLFLFLAGIILVVFWVPISVTLVRTSLLSSFLLISCHVFCLVLLQLICLIFVLVLVCVDWTTLSTPAAFFLLMGLEGG